MNNSTQPTSTSPLVLISSKLKCGMHDIHPTTWHPRSLAQHGVKLGAAPPLVLGNLVPLYGPYLTLKEWNVYPKMRPISTTFETNALVDYDNPHMPFSLHRWRSILKSNKISMLCVPKNVVPQT